ncbi:MAG: peptidylprolyl isomerase [Brachymonas sp.]|nr:peptidylprolyl isomerase [Brachymonas sp.]
MSIQTLTLGRSKIAQWLLLAALCLGVAAVQAAPRKKAAAAASKTKMVEAKPQVLFRTNLGEFTVELEPAAAPKTVENFLQYVNSGHYNGTIFHRVISNFMVQGGGFDAKLAQKPTRAPVVHEGRQALQAGLRNTVGSLAMARTSEMNSATAQFFINVKDNAFLDPTPIPDGDPVPRFVYQGKTYANLPRAQLLRHPGLAGYTVFGKVISGMDVIEKIRTTPTGAAGPFSSDVPKTTVLIESARQIK